MAIKMICSDIDGTLLQYGRKKLEGEIFDQIRALHDRGILFCPASGRQYTSLRLLFAPVADCCVFLCENGGVLFKDEHCIAENPMPRALAEEIAHDLWDRSDGQGEVMLSGQNCAYLMERGLGMLDRIQFIGNRYKVISDPSRFPRRSSRCRSTCMRAWKSTRTALCRAGSRPTARGRPVLDRHDHRQQGCRRRVALPRAGLRP